MERLKKLIVSSVVLLFTVNLCAQNSDYEYVHYIVSNPFSNADNAEKQEWNVASIVNPSCPFKFLDIKIYSKKVSGTKANEQVKYRYKFEITNNSKFNIDFTYKWDFENSASGSLGTFRPGTTRKGIAQVSESTSNINPTLTISRVKFEFNKGERELYNLPYLSDNLTCFDTSDNYIKKKQKENEKKIEVQKEDSRKIEKNNNYNSISTDNDSYTNSSNNTSANNKPSYEERIKQEKLNKAREIEKETQRNIDRIENAKRTALKGVDDLFTNWANERDFYNKVSSLKTIKSVDASGIINETRYKSQEINNTYAKRKNKLMNMSLDALNKLMNSSQNESQLITNTAIGVGVAVFSQVSANNQRKKLLKQLEEEKNRKLNELANKIKEKYKPVANSYLQKAKYAVNKEEESYYLKHYKHNKCMIENALSVVLQKESCTKLKSKSFVQKRNYTGQDYYNTYLRKKENPITAHKAEYFLELAIKREPNNDKWLYEKSKSKDLNLMQKLSILKKCLVINEFNENIREEYDSGLISLKLLQEELNSIEKTNLEKQDNYKVGQTLFDKYDFVEIKKDGFLVSKNNLFGYVNFKGVEIVPTEYKFLDDFSEGLAIAKKDTKYGYINKKGGLIIPFKFRLKPFPFKNGYAKIKKSNVGLNIVLAAFGDDGNEVSYYLIDKKGKPIDNKKYTEIKNFSEGKAYVGKSKALKYSSGFINQKGVKVINLDEYYDANSFSEGYSALINKSSSKGGMYGYINHQGEIKIPFRYKIANSFKNNLALVMKDDKFGFINKQNKTVIPFLYDSGKSMGSFIKDHAFVSKNNKWGLINSKGELIYPIKYSDTLQLKNDLIQTKASASIVKKPETLKKPKTLKDIWNEELSYVFTGKTSIDYINFKIDEFLKFHNKKVPFLIKATPVTSRKSINYSHSGKIKIKKGGYCIFEYDKFGKLIKVTSKNSKNEFVDDVNF